MKIFINKYQNKEEEKDQIICHAVITDDKKRFNHNLKQLQKYTEIPYKEKLTFLV